METTEERNEYFDNLHRNIIKKDRASTEHANNSKYIPGNKLINTQAKDIGNDVKSDLDKFD